MIMSIVLKALIISCMTFCAQMGKESDKSFSKTTKIQDFNKNPDAIKLYKNAINVKDFGAKGDGIHDDTEAINRALHATQAKRSSLRVGDVKGFRGGSGDAVVKAVVFPPGVYKISDTLIGYREMRLQGIGKAVLLQTNPKKDIYYQHGLFRSYVDNLVFKGGKTQLRFWTRNNNASLIFVTNCRFIGSSKAAIRCFSFCEKRLKGSKWMFTKPIGPYETKKDPDGRLRIVRERDVNKLQHWANSTLMTVSGCYFENCALAFNMGSDGTVFENSKIVVDSGSSGPVMICHGKFDIRNIECVSTATRNSRYWIKADTKHFSCRNSKFISKEPMCLLKFDRSPWYESNSLIIEGCETNAAGCAEGGVVELKNIPNAFYFTNNTESSDRKVKAVSWKMPTDKNIFDKRKYFKASSTNPQFNFCITGNSKNIDERLPKIVNPYIKPYPSKELLAEVSIQQDVFTNENPPSMGKLVFAVDFGVVGDGVTDDSAALQKAVDAAGALQNALVVLPAAKIMLAKTVNLPTKCALTSDGRTYFIGDGSVNAFAGVGVKSFFASHIAFKGFLSAFNLRTAAVGRNSVVFSECIFYNCVNASIKLMSGTGKGVNKDSLLIKNSLLNSKTMVDTDVAYAKLSNIWLQGSWEANDQAYVINRGGAMLVESVLGVPRGLKGRDLKKTSGGVVKCEYGDNLRWFDNYGKLVIKDTRFGGETGGICAVYMLSENATLFLEGGAITMNNKYTKHCYAYFVKPPKWALFMATNNIPGRILRRIWIKSPDCGAIKPASVFVSGPGVGMVVRKDANGVQNAYYK